MEYRILCQKHNDYCELRPIWDELEDLYIGGYRIRNNARKYLPRLVGEPTERYSERLREASYICYASQIIDFFASNLFVQPLAINAAPDADDETTPGILPDTPFYSFFESNCDRKKTSFNSMLKQIFLTAIIKGQAHIAIDFPIVGKEDIPTTLFDEDMLGSSNAYVFEVQPEDIINWELSDTGTFNWCVLHRKSCVQSNPLVYGKTYLEEFKVWSQDKYTDIVSWKKFAVKYDKEHPPKETDDIPEVEAGTTSFICVPIISLRISDGLWIGNKIGCLCAEHFRTRSALKASEARSLFEVPVYRLGSELGDPHKQLASSAQQNENRDVDPLHTLANKGWVTIGKDDKLEFAGPSGVAYQIVDKQLIDLKNEIFRVVHQLAAAVGVTGKSAARSGVSKQEDRRAEAIVLGEFGQLMREFALKIYDVISEARNEFVIWNAHGLDHFEIFDRESIVNEALQLGAIEIPSKTFQKLISFDTVRKLTPFASPETLAQIKIELEENIDNNALAKEHEGVILGMKDEESDKMVLDEDSNDSESNL